MNPAFDIAAQTYDQEFTDTPIGRAQRNRVWRYMRKVLSKYEHARILELNCGTGEDAVFMAELGHEVVATDISTEMLKQTQKKAVKEKHQNRIHIRQLDLAAPVLEGEAPFDVIFSNFGGLNCLSEKQLKELGAFLKRQLKPGGQCVFVIMPPTTFLEKVFRWYNKELDKYRQRRNKKGLPVSVGEVKLLTFFYTTSEIKKVFKGFQYQKAFSTGFIPSYFERNKFLNFLLIGDKVACTLNINSNRADHFLIHLSL